MHDGSFKPQSWTTLIRVTTRRGVRILKFAISDAPRSAWQDRVIQELACTMGRYGHATAGADDVPHLVLHAIKAGDPRPFRRRSRSTFVVAVAEGPVDESQIQSGYPILVRSLANLLLYGAGTGTRQADTYFITPELGRYPIGPFEDATPAWGDRAYQRIQPLAESHFVIDNIFDEDLPAELASGTPVTEAMTWASRILDSWHLFPAPFPIQDILSPADYRHLQKVFTIGGLSYGNLSARHDQHRFWMSASGVDKGKIGTVSDDILLVKGYDAEQDAIRLSVSPGSRPHRVSVDAVEHWGVYQAHPDIGAMVHIHAWVEGIPSTAINYPCGTVEMGQEMARLLDQDPHPERTIVGLRNHGITATGPTFEDIIGRLEGRVRPQVPMN